MKNYVTACVCLFAASISAGIGLQDIVPYSMIMGVGMAVLFLLLAAVLAGKKKTE
ncbi:hypothetical protein MUG87_19310 [Ectobacillus sp. JY-23]|uniref:hypothetical protein n=1 Tax=Ectobacillus sp. JY-23 TaxID=2933872 RepID=UPI001FF5D367|nr:hypothetical protein [Ectobacillus sp. JY-23]UOY92531.1 hypothetical protein MUG87_19310 [Ectobacillus sp. JY-23]